MTFADLKLRLRALFRRNRVEQELDEELAFHIERETQKLMDAGMAPAEARTRARANFGSAALTADECRDARGTSFIDNTARDIQYALRTFAKAPLSALTIVVTVATGLGVVAVLFTMLNAMTFRVDTVPGVDRMYTVDRVLPPDGSFPMFTRGSLDAMRAETQVFTDAYATVGNIDLFFDGRPMAITLVTGNFFDVVQTRPVMGRAFTMDDDGRAGGSPVMVLSDRGWTRHFNRDPNVLGRTVLVNGAPFSVIGVSPAGFRGLEVLGPDAWAPLAQVGQFQEAARGREDQIGVELVGRLRPGVSKEQAIAQLVAWDSAVSADSAGLKARPTDGTARPPAVTLTERQGTVPWSMETVGIFAPLFVAFGLILLIGCANVANLLLARGVVRQREIGIRLSLGASRPRIVRQLMTESIMLALAAAGVGYMISRIALESGVSWMLRTMPLDLGDINLSVPAADWRVALFLVVSAVLATGFFALVPALRATSVNPVQTLRGELVKDTRPGRTRSVLIGLQVFASALLLVCCGIFLRSAISSAQFDPGLRTADTVLIDINDPTRAALASAIQRDTAVSAHAAVRPQFLAPLRVVLADTGAGKSPVAFKSVSGSYFHVLDIPIVAGRTFSPSERDHDAVAIVSESTARALWPDGNAVGRTLTLEPEEEVQKPGGFLTVNPDAPVDDGLARARTVTVIGVSGDVRGFRITDVREAGVFLPTTLDVANTSVIARVQGQPNVTRQALLERLTKVDPNMGAIITLQTVARLETFFLQIAFGVSLILGGLALLLTVSGLFSVLSYLVEQRTREIGVRVALGASSGRVTRLVLAQTTRPVVAGLVLGAGLAAALASAVLASPAGAMISQIVHLTDPIAYLGSLAVIVVACVLAAWIPAARASRVDPIKALRQD